MRVTQTFSSTLFVLILSGCGGDKNSFNLVCDTDRSIEYFDGEKYSKTNEKESLTFKFVNQGLNEFNCSVWADSEIRCHQLIEHPVWKLHDLKFDRVSGQFYAVRQNGWHTDKVRNTTVWRGRCERADKAKF